MATPPTPSAWSLGSEVGQVLTPHLHSYLEVPIAIVEIESEALEASPELLVILGTKGREREGREVAKRVPPLHPLLPQDLCGHSSPIVTCFPSLPALGLLGRGPTHGPASGEGPTGP